jgi:hypothetical protein
MTRITLLAVALMFAATASAQMYRWVDKDGHVHYTAQPPPPGIQSRTLGTPPPASSSPAEDAEGNEAGGKEPEAKDAPKGPLTPVQQEQEFRKRQLEAQKAHAKEAQAAKEAETKRENCSRARETLATFESGVRISRSNAQGERYYLDDAARDRETEAARKAVSDWCGG